MDEQKTNKPRKKNYKYFIGVDISRNELDFAVMAGKELLFHKEIANQPADILAFVGELKMVKGLRVTNTVFCMEHTGIYGNHLLSVLRKLKANVVVENPLKIKNSMGLLRGKDDKTDAIRIA